ncbi:DNA methylase N-4 [Clostridia bacterium]|nr:DNA methylase N-4 [Clostridia bacterium]
MDDKFVALSMDMEQESRDRLQSVFPECFADGKLQIDKLLNLCGEYIEDDFEKYEFRWKGKVEAQKLANRRTAGTLLPDKESGADWDTTKNIYIEGDNLEVLKLLQTSYFRKVKMIYIDPPYNTGHDFVYEDNFADPIASYKEITSQATKSNPETMGRFHTNWLNMMFPRLRLAANLLRDDGVIFISIDDTEVRNLRYLLDDIFGEENFVAQIIWERAFAPVNLMKHFSKSHDYILCYAKHIDDLICYGLPRTSEADERYQNPDNDPRGVWSSSDISVGPAVESNIYPIKTPSGRIVKPPAGRSWSLSENAFSDRLQDNRIWFGEDGDGVPRIKRFLTDLRKEGMTPMTVWKYTEVGHSQEAKKKLNALFDGKAMFDYPKGVELIKRMLSLYTKNEDLIVDFFSGSATTAHAVMQLNAEDGGNRRFICVQLPELTEEKSEAYKAGYKNICEIGKERIRRAGAKIKAENQLTAPNLDTGFRAFKLDTSNLKAWDMSPIREKDPAIATKILLDRLRAHIDILNPDRSDLDVTFEVMLKFGQDLCEAVIPLNINGKTVYGVCANVKFIVCLAPDVSAEDAEEMAKYAPGRIVFADSCFDNTEQKTNVKLILRDKGITIKSL